MADTFWRTDQTTNQQPRGATFDTFDTFDCPLTTSPPSTLHRSWRTLLASETIEATSLGSEANVTDIFDIFATFDRRVTSSTARTAGSGVPISELASQ